MLWQDGELHTRAYHKLETDPMYVQYVHQDKNFAVGDKIEEPSEEKYLVGDDDKDANKQVKIIIERCAYDKIQEELRWDN